MPRDPRKFPTSDELLSWWIYWRLDSLPDSDFTPPFIYKEIKSFQDNGCQAIHRKMYEEYSDFRKEFLPHDYVTPDDEIQATIDEIEASVAAKRRRHQPRRK